MKLAIIDLDGVVANVDARFEQAKADAEAAFVDRAYEKRDYDNVYWRAVFNPEYVPMDVLIDGVKQDLEFLRYTREYELMFLTSRPESMRLATDVWLYQHNIQFLTDAGRTALIMKPSAFQYTKTVVWKAGMVQTLSAFYHASEVLVIDDEVTNANEIVKYATVAPVVPGLMIARSLSEAVQKLNGTWEEPDPFLPDFPDEV